MRIFLIIAALVVAALAGCLGDDNDTGSGPDDDATPDADPVPPHVVVAVIDSGVNVYHEVYQREASLPDGVLAQFTDDGEAPQRITLTQSGGYDERLEADQAVWDGMERERLYYFEGTNVLGISFTQGGDPVLDDGSHGTGTTGAVLAANPEAVIVLVEGVGSGAGEQWAASQPWIDFLSESYGPPGSPPTWLVEGSATAEANHVAWDGGKIPVGAADNSPALAPGDSTAGPPWVVGVAGDDPDAQCREHLSGTFPDFTADFTQDLPAAGTIDEYRPMSGTSFATPTTAGTFSAALLAVREAWDHRTGILDGALASNGTERLDNVGLRDAFNRTAYYFGAEDCEPGGTGQPVNPAAPWTQMGWGHVGPEIVDATVAHILGIEEAPDKPTEAKQFQEGIYEGRRQAWAGP